MRRDLLKASALVVGLSLVGIPVIASSGAADEIVLHASFITYPAFGMSLTDASGEVGGRTLPTGSYKVDGVTHEGLHGFHLQGPGVDIPGDIGGHDEIHAIVSAPGSYTLFCDNHPTTMRSTFTIAAPATTSTSSPSTTATTETTTTETTTQTTTTSTTTTTSAPPPTVAKAKPITGWVSSTGIGLRQNGKKVLMLSAGAYKLTVDDRSKKDNFHLMGPKLDRKTGKVFKGKVTWQLVLKKNHFYRFRSDAHPKKFAGFVHAH